MAKLIYIHTLGYPTTFAQMECLKLVVSQYYSDKRIGYLGLMLLMDEKQEVLMLVTNSLRSDLSHPNHFIVGLALCSLANIASPEMCRDCSPDIEKLLQTSNPYITKKATLCAVRICRKVSDLRENFVNLVRPLIGAKNHGVKLTGITLLTELLERRAVSPKKFRDLVPSLVASLKALTVSGYSPEYDVSGATDPFLQVRILKLLRILGARDSNASEAMNDVLAQVATNTETTRNVGNAILYEAVQTIMTIKSETGLKVLAVNILGKFLANKDNNIRYVALNTLSKVVAHDVQSVQRHRNTIVDCLKDADVSIRRRALDLIYSLVNPQNVRILVRELLNFLLVSDVQFRPDLTAKLCAVAERHAPNRRWHIDTMLRVLSLAGAYVPEQVPHALIFTIGNTPELHAYAAYRMHDALARQGVTAHDTLTQVAVWCIGEYGDLLVAPPAPPLDPSTMRVSEDDALQLLETVAQRSMTPSSDGSRRLAPDSQPLYSSVASGDAARVRGYVTTALVKLTTRFSANSQQRITSLLTRFATHIDPESQQRAVEYLALRQQTDDIKREIVQRMPVLDEEQMKARGLVNKPVGEEDDEAHDDDDDDDDEEGNDDKPAAKSKPASQAAPTPVQAPPSGLIDLDDVFGSVSTGAAAGSGTTSGGGASSTGGGLAGLEDIFGAPALTPNNGGGAPANNNVMGGGLDDLLGGPLPPMNSTPTSSTGAVDLLSDVSGSMGGLDDLLGGGAAPAPSPAPANNAAGNTHTAYDKNGVRIQMLGQKHPTNPSLSMIQAQFYNATSAPLNNFQMQIAVPKYIKLQLEPATGTVVPPSAPGAPATVTQVLKLANSMHGQKPLLLKVKIDYQSMSGTVS
eukprot:CAMPEP_0168586044 /NCGR_PEP_ID=MMETSP0420-20121227/4058_1 /TAXON_ID=498008 /ORGANISM="Pessonella sp." /LENGTH=858 /DNA_ID=CAMNT_0008621077 /DNA_START=61 /DNA_END=2634 /DNA_ORIENTATION=+